MSAVCFRVNQPSVIHERFGEELIAIHLGTGSYHSMSGAGTDAFLLLVEGATTEELAGALADKYAATPQEIAKGLESFLKELEKEQLIVQADTPAERAPLRIEGNQHGLPFMTPALQAFNDLEGLLLLDPIHEVGEEGWPPSSPSAR